MLIKNELLLMLIIGISASATSSGCPRKEELPQCECVDRVFSGLYLNCGERGMTIEEYVKIFQENNISANKEMTIYFENLADRSTIPSRIFEGFDIKNLDIYFSEHILSWADEEGGPALVGLENSLEEFTAFSSINIPRRNYNQSGKAPMSLGHLGKLRRVDLTNNNIHTFGNGWFDKGPSSLEILWIRYCNVHYFGDQAFAGLSNLREIRMQHNEFQSLSRSTFPNPAYRLERIDFSFNELKYLSDDFFTDMPALAEVDLAGNPITRLPEPVWRPVWSHLNELKLLYTELNCDDIQWMFTLKPPKKMWATCQKPNHMYGVDLKKLIRRQRQEN